MTSQSAPTATVLLVDDNVTNLKVLYETLDGRGHRLLAARSGEQALEIASRASPDLILLDIMMPPGMDGYETLAKLKATPAIADVPVIFLSSLDDTDNKVRGLELGAVDYIAKPFQAAEVIARVECHLTIHALQAELAARNEALARANAAMQADLEAAGRIQQALLPSRLPASEGFEFAWHCAPCTHLGGDALDIFELDARTVGFYLMDVSGHGVPAALLAVAATRALAPRADRSSIVVEPGWDGSAARPVPPGEVLRRLNLLYPMESARNPHFITMIYGLLDLGTGDIRYACAGHPGPIVVRADGTCEVLDGGSAPIGVMDVTDYADLTVRLAPGDRVVLHSDGVNEHCSPAGEEFGMSRLLDALAERLSPLDSGLVDLVSRLQAFSAGEQARDDMSLLGLSRWG